jgi:hypothetical protein
MINKLHNVISHEAESWIHTLRFLRAENNMRITSLNRIILSSTYPHKIEKVENYLQLFINQYNMIRLLEIEIQFFNQSIQERINFQESQNFISSKNRLRTGMKNAITAFYQLYENFECVFFTELDAEDIQNLS